MNSEEILETLRYPGETVPREELAEIVRRREEFVPVLIAEIETATRLGAEADLDDSLASFALYLLAELRETQALEPILEFFALDETTEEELFGDMITMSGAAILAAVAQDNPAALREYAKRQDLSVWVRGAVFGALVRQVLWGEQPRASVVRFFSELIEANQFGDDPDAWTALVNACMDFHPREFLDGIRELYDREVVDVFVVGPFEDVEEEAAEDPESHHRRSAERRGPITDAARAVAWWAQFERPRPLEHSWNAPVRPAVPAIPIRNAPKVGRNDLCPCGSGKKYKKCCLATA